VISLLGDGWFYISAGGFLLSSLLFVFLLGQYRAAVEAEDRADDAEELPVPVPVKAAEKAEKVYVPKAVSDALPPAPRQAAKPAVEPEPEELDEPAPAPVAARPAPQPAPAAAAAPPAEAAKKGAGLTGSTTTSGISPAIVYLQNLKAQMERLDKDVVGLKSAIGQQASQNEQIVGALSALTAKIEALAQAQADALAAPSRPEGRRARAKAEPARQPEPRLERVEDAASVAAQEAPAEAVAAPAAELKLEVPVETTREEPAAAADEPPAPQAAEPSPAPVADSQPQSEPEPEPAAAAEPQPPAAEPPAPARARKGPVWPI